MSLPPPPPPPVPQQAPDVGSPPVWSAALRPAPRPGTLTPAWRIVMAVCWSGILLGFAAVWDSSRTLGLATWWLGSTSEPRPFVVQLLPPALALVVVIGALRSMRLLPVIGIVAALALAVVGLVDLGRFERFGWTEIALAAAGLLVSLASFAGLQRAVEDRVSP